MTEVTYAQAYTEVLEVLKHLPKVQYEKIPKDKIEFYKRNCDSSYRFELQRDLKNVSAKANAILVLLYREYFTNEKQKETLKNILADNQKKAEEFKHEKYNPDDLFKNNSNKQEVNEEQTQMIAYKPENILQKVWNKIKSFLWQFKK